MRAFLAKARLGLISPALALAGMGLIAFGVALVYLPAGIIVGGLLLVAAAVDARL